jgi:hypothetical protein
LKIQKSFAKKMEFRNGKVPATSDSSAGSLVFAHAHNYRIQTQQKSRIAPWKQKEKKRRESKDRGELCSCFYPRETSKKVEVSFGSVFVRERTQSARAL